MTSLPNDSKLINITRHRSESLQSYDSEKLGVTPPKRERRFSLSQMLGRRTSVEDHLVRDSKSMINGDGFDKSNYVKLTSASNTNAAEKVDLNDVMLRQNRILHNTGQTVEAVRGIGKQCMS
ncbi:hypothetical protein Tcan_15059 [Toxocara canis]|uniref:Uncharacterized protein n=1 Tax=Toxocara canis TaxID=6265 RepID=A0A0B2VKH5_TOXCA|nr:hypothetical protein Tcan_15059 [Toxocara canis]